MPVKESNANGDSIYMDDMNMAGGDRENAMADTNAKRGWIIDVNLKKIMSIRVCVCVYTIHPSLPV